MDNRPVAYDTKTQLGGFQSLGSQVPATRSMCLCPAKEADQLPAARQSAMRHVAAQIKRVVQGLRSADEQVTFALVNGRGISPELLVKRAMIRVGGDSQCVEQELRRPLGSKGVPGESLDHYPWQRKRSRWPLKLQSLIASRWKRYRA